MHGMIAFIAILNLYIIYSGVVFWLVQSITDEQCESSFSFRCCRTQESVCLTLDVLKKRKMTFKNESLWFPLMSIPLIVATSTLYTVLTPHEPLSSPCVSWLGNGLVWNRLLFHLAMCNAKKSLRIHISMGYLYSKEYVYHIDPCV